MLDLLIKGANLPDGREGHDLAIQDGRFVEVARAIEASAGQVIDAAGRLVTPPFVDCHFHMDSTLSVGQPRHNESASPSFASAVAESPSTAAVLASARRHSKCRRSST